MNRSAEHRLGSLRAAVCPLAGSETGAPIPAAKQPANRTLGGCYKLAIRWWPEKIVGTTRKLS